MDLEESVPLFRRMASIVDVKVSFTEDQKRSKGSFYQKKFESDVGAFKIEVPSKSIIAVVKPKDSMFSLLNS